MITLIKLAGVSMILSAGVVTALEAPRASGALPSGKIYEDRILPDNGAYVVADASGSLGDKAVVSDARQVMPTSSDCRAQAWPYKAQDCVDGGQVRRAVRTITIERRDAPNTSTLVRLPAGQASN